MTNVLIVRICVYLLISLAVPFGFLWVVGEFNKEREVDGKVSAVAYQIEQAVVDSGGWVITSHTTDRRNNRRLLLEIPSENISEVESLLTTYSDSIDATLSRSEVEGNYARVIVGLTRDEGWARNAESNLVLGTTSIVGNVAISVFIFIMFFLALLTTIESSVRPRAHNE